MVAVGRSLTSANNFFFLQDNGTCNFTRSEYEYEMYLFDYTDSVTISKLFAANFLLKDNFTNSRQFFFFLIREYLLSILSIYKLFNGTNNFNLLDSFIIEYPLIHAFTNDVFSVLLYIIIEKGICRFHKRRKTDVSNHKKSQRYENVFATCSRPSVRTRVAFRSWQWSEKLVCQKNSRGRKDP